MTGVDDQVNVFMVNEFYEMFNGHTFNTCFCTLLVPFSINYEQYN